MAPCSQHIASLRGSTPHFHAELEARARTNLTHAIARNVAWR